MKRFLLGLLLLGSASASELRLYTTFGEVREGVQLSGREYTLNLPPDAWGQLLPGTLDLEGLNVVARRQILQNAWLQGLEGKAVTLIEEGRSERVTLVRAKDLLVRDAAGRYRTARFEQLAFDAPPPENALAPGQSVTFAVAAPGRATLSYLTRALSWSPRYALNLSGTNARLTAFADIRNNGETAYEVTAGELLAGQVSVNEPPPVPLARAGVEMSGAANDAFAAPKVVSAGESRGLYRYTLEQDFTLAGNSTLSLPFLTPRTTFERYAGLDSGFQANSTKGKLNRNYRLKADVLLPAGPITVRDEGRIVGQAEIVDTSANDPIELSLGADPDLSYTRSVEVLRQDRTGGSYRVTLLIENAKDRALRAEVREGLSGNVTLQGQAERTPQGLLVRAEVPAKGQVTRTYTVTVRYGQ